MIALSSRYLLALFGLLVIAAVPIAYHVRPATNVDDCLNRAEMYSASRIAGAVGASERVRKHRKGVFQWTEGRFYRSEEHLNVPTFRIIRSFSFGEFFFEPKEFFIGNPPARNDTAMRRLRVGNRGHWHTNST